MAPIARVSVDDGGPSWNPENQRPESPVAETVALAYAQEEALVFRRTPLTDTPAKTGTMQERTLGEIIREGRLAQKLGLRELARELGITPSYLSDIENDRRVPSEDVLRKLAARLNLDVDHLLALAGRFGDDAERYMKRNPSVGVLFRRISENKLKEDDIQKLVDQVEKLGKDKHKDQ